jgi:receptor protein-tyrosine kinase
VQDAEALSLERTLGVLRRRLPLIALVCIVAAAAAYGVSKHQTKKYTATSSLSFGVNSLSQQIVGLPSNTSGGTLLAQQANNLELVKRGNMAVKTAAALGNGLTEGSVASSLEITGQGESGVVDIAATVTSPKLAAAIANTYAGEFVHEQEQANQKFLESALSLVHKQLAALSPEQRVGADGLQLQNRAQTLGLLSQLRYDGVQLAGEAVAPSNPSSPKTKRNTALGGFLGLILGLGIAFMLERLDRRIRSPEELESIYGIPLLGAVPKSTTLARDEVPRSAEVEAFGLIRARLRFFDVERELRTIVIASPSSGDGSTTVARQLAEAGAMLGSRTLLLEVDLRNPQIARQFGIDPGPGLPEVLVGTTALETACRAVHLAASGVRTVEGRKLDVLTAGSAMPPNPAELLESHAMGVVLERIRSTYDLVVIDAPPLAAVSDAYPLLDKADGVVIVGRMGSRREDAERVHQTLARSPVRLLGVIANGVKSRAPDPYASKADTDRRPSPPASGSGTSRSDELVPSAKA